MVFFWSVGRSVGRFSFKHKEIMLILPCPALPCPAPENKWERGCVAVYGRSTGLGLGREDGLDRDEQVE